jgi:hypothetical protein
VRKVRFEAATKRYYLHYIFSGPQPAAAAGDQASPGQKSKAGGARGRGGKGSLPAMMGTREAMLKTRPAHYGTAAPHEALFEGFFLDPGTARQYSALWTGEYG